MNDQNSQTLTFSNGQYVGDIVNGQRTGKGIYTWNNGNKYEGDYVDGKRTGKGVFTWANGDRYEGDFLDNRRTGKGKFTSASGIVYEGNFMDGQLVCSNDESTGDTDDGGTLPTEENNGTEREKNEKSVSKDNSETKTIAKGGKRKEKTKDKIPKTIAISLETEIVPASKDKPKDEKHIHTFINTVIPPTCTEHGYTLHRCDCGYEHRDTFTQKKPHEFGEWLTIKAETCTEDGNRERKCKNCPEIEQEVIPAPGHDWSEWSIGTFATCSKAGFEVRRCPRCEETEKRTVSALGHKYTEWKPSNSKDGKWERFCENCGSIECIDCSPQEAKERAKKKRDTSLCIGVTTIIAVIIALIILTTKVFIPISNYNSAVDLYVSEQYEEALVAFTEMEGYKDSARQIGMCKSAIKDRNYNSAIELYDLGKYEEAIAAFNEMGVYKGSPRYIELCETGIKENNYQTATTLYKLGKYEEAITAFEKIGDYKDSKKQIKLCKREITYISATRLYQSEKYNEALVAFTTIEGFKDSLDYLEKCKAGIMEDNYESATELLNAGKYDEAISTFVALGDYKDSDERVLLCEKEWLKTCVIGETVIIGSYEQDGDLSNGTEKIEWIVLDKKEGRVMLISKYALDSQRFYRGSSNFPTWDISTLRKWLNDEFFISAFSYEEQNMINESFVSADRNPEYSSTYPGESTYDKVFLLSINEAEKFFDSYEKRMFVATQYATDINSSDDWGTDELWLRSPGKESKTYSYICEATIDSNGYIDFYGELYFKNCYIRPVIWINLES